MGCFALSVCFTASLTISFGATRNFSRNLLLRNGPTASNHPTFYVVPLLKHIRCCYSAHHGFWLGLSLVWNCCFVLYGLNQWIARLLRHFCSVRYDSVFHGIGSALTCRIVYISGFRLHVSTGRGR